MKVLRTPLLILNEYSRTPCKLTVFAVCTLTAWGRSATYKVHLAFNHQLHATVEAQLEAPDGVIFTADHAGGYAWWDFIKRRSTVAAATFIQASPARTFANLPPNFRHSSVFCVFPRS